MGRKICTTMDEYIDELYASFVKGRDVEGFDEKDIFIALIENMLKEIKISLEG